MDKQAIRPNFYQEFSSGVERIADVKEVDEDQQALSYITHYRGWELLKKYSQTLEEFLDSTITVAMQNGMSSQEIGERTMVKELSKLVLKSLIDKAENARRAEEK